MNLWLIAQLHRKLIGTIGHDLAQLHSVDSYSEEFGCTSKCKNGPLFSAPQVPEDDGSNFGLFISRLFAIFFSAVQKVNGPYRGLTANHFDELRGRRSPPSLCRCSPWSLNNNNGLAGGNRFHFDGLSVSRWWSWWSLTTAKKLLTLGGKQINIPLERRHRVDGDYQNLNRAHLSAPLIAI